MLDRGMQNQGIVPAVESNLITQPQMDITLTLSPLMYDLMIEILICDVSPLTFVMLSKWN